MFLVSMRRETIKLQLLLKTLFFIIYILTGDIEELYKTPLEKGHIAAFSEDCQGQNKRLSRLNVCTLSHYQPHVSSVKRSIHPCFSFIPTSSGTQI